jgi:hypothetical protein
MSAILEHPHRKVRRAGIASAGIVVVVLGLAAAARLARAQATSQHDVAGPGLTVSIISPANGGGAPGQTLQAGVFAITNDVGDPLTINSVTIAFSHPALFSSATLKPLNLNDTSARFDVNGPPPAPPTASPPVASTTFSFGFPVIIGPGSEPAFALEVTLSPLSRYDSGDVAFAAMTPSESRGGAATPLWIALAILGLATAALSEGTRRRAWLIAGLLILFAVGAPGCGSDSGGSPSSTQTVIAVVSTANFEGVVARTIGGQVDVGGLPLKIGTIFGQ